MLVGGLTEVDETAPGDPGGGPIRAQGEPDGDGGVDRPSVVDSSGWGNEIGPKMLKDFQKKLAPKYTRQGVAKRIGRIKRFVKWCASEELIKRYDKKHK